jgi:hypothetical protein
MLKSSSIDTLQQWQSGHALCIERSRILRVHRFVGVDAGVGRHNVIGRTSPQKRGILAYMGRGFRSILNDGDDSVHLSPQMNADKHGCFSLKQVLLCHCCEARSPVSMLNRIKIVVREKRKEREKPISNIKFVFFAFFADKSMH